MITVAIRPRANADLRSGGSGSKCVIQGMVLGLPGGTKPYGGSALPLGASPFGASRFAESPFSESDDCGPMDEAAE